MSRKTKAKPKANRDLTPGDSNPYLTEIKEILENVLDELQYLKRFLERWDSNPGKEETSEK